MTTRDLTNHLESSQSIAPAAQNATVDGASADTLNADSADVEFQLGLYTDGSYVLKVQESDDDSTFNDVAAADLIGAFTAVAGVADDNTLQRVGYKGNKRFLRARLEATGATTGIVAGATVIKGHLHGTPS